MSTVLWRRSSELNGGAQIIQQLMNLIDKGVIDIEAPWQTESRIIGGEDTELAP